MSAIEARGHDLRDSKRPPIGQRLSERLFSHLQGQLTGLVVAVAQPTALVRVSHGFEHLAGNKRLELFGRVG